MVFWNHQLFTVRRPRQFILRWGTANKIEQCITCYIFCKQKFCLLVLQNETGFSISVMIWQRTVRPLVLPILRWHHNTCNSLLVVPNIQLNCFPTTMLLFFIWQQFNTKSSLDKTVSDAVTTITGNCSVDYVSYTYSNRLKLFEF